MSHENLMSHLNFSVNVRDYTASAAFKDTNNKTYNKSASKQADNEKFSDFIKPHTAKENHLSDKSDKSRKADYIKEDRGSDVNKAAGRNNNNKNNNGNDAVKASDSLGKTACANEAKPDTKAAATQDAQASQTSGDQSSLELTQASSSSPQSIVITDASNFPLSISGGCSDAIKADAVRLIISPADVSDTFSKVSDKLQALISAIMNLSGEQDFSEAQSSSLMDNSDIALALSPEGEEALSPQEAGSLMTLLNMILGQMDDSGENLAADGVGVGVGESVLQTVITKMQDGGDADLREVLSGLSSEELDMLKEEIGAYLTSEISLEEQKELIGLIAQHYPSALPLELQANGGSSALQAVSSPMVEAPLPEMAAANQNNKVPARDLGADSADIADNVDNQSPEEESAALRSKMDGVSGDDTVKTRSQKEAPNANGAGDRFLQASNSGQSAAVIAAGDAAVIAAQEGAIGVGSAMMSVAAQTSLSSAGAQAQNAGHAHPATQLVSMTMQKAIKNGEATTIKLQLDPPELGRVEVKMSIDQDNMTKIVLTAEKADTHAMLQRDAQMLERAMSDAGLDAGGNLSFELASDGHKFGESNQPDENHGGSRASGGIDPEAENAIITHSSTMDWYVDPATGRMHYSILA